MLDHLRTTNRNPNSGSPFRSWEGKMSNVLSSIHRARTRSARTAQARVGQALIALVLISSLLGLSNIRAAAAGPTYYVDNTVTCSDSNAGTLQTAPLCTIAAATSKATAAGSTVVVLHGTYAETVLPHNGTAGNPI